VRRLLKLGYVGVGTCTGITWFKAVNSCLAAGTAWLRNGLNDHQYWYEWQ